MEKMKVKSILMEKNVKVKNILMKKHEIEAKKKLRKKL